MGFQAIAVQMGVAWGLGMLNRAMAGRPPRPPKPRPDDIEFPLTRVGTPIGLVYGTVRIDNPVLVWAGLFLGTPEPGFPGAFRYSASALFVLGTPPQRDNGTQWSAPVLRNIWIADKATLLTFPGGVLTHGNSIAATIDLGREGNGGWFRGYFEFFDGRDDQLITNWPSNSPAFRIDKAFKAAGAGIDRSLVPGYRHQMLLAAVCDATTAGSNASFGEQAQFPTLSAEVSVVDGDAVNTLDANPAWVAYDLICARVFKLGYDTNLVDEASFAAAAPILVTEGNGCSMHETGEQDIEQLLNAICEQMDGTLDEDPNTGKISLRLIRRDYEPDLSDLRELNHTNTVGRPKITQTGWLDNANHVDVEFTNRSKQYKPDSVPAKRLSNAINQNYRSRPRTIRYPYCMTAALAGKLAARDAAVLCRPLMTCSAELDRGLYDLRRGQAVKANWPQFSIVNKVFRVLDIDRGQLHDDLIRVTLIEDVFDNALGAIDPGTGTVAIADAYPILHRLVDEAPLWLTRAAHAQGVISDTTTPRLLAAGRKESAQQGPTPTVFGDTRTGANPYANDLVQQPFPTTAKVATAYDYWREPYDTSTGLVIEGVTGETAAIFEDPLLIGENIVDGGLVATTGQVAGGANQIQINGEILAFESVTALGGGQYRLNNVWRGLHDTTADDHAAGDVLFFLDYDLVGHRAWTRGTAIDVSLRRGGDSTERKTDELVFAGDVLSGVVGRAVRALRGADFRANAIEFATGQLGSPASDANFKRLDKVEGSLDAVWRQRNEEALVVVRGDDATAYSVQDGALWRLLARKVGEEEVEIEGPLSIGSVSTVALMLGAAGHGEIDLLLRTDGEFGESWQDARVRVSAHRARNLLGNAVAQYVALAPWTNQTGTTTIMQNSDSLERTASGRYFKAATHVDGVTILEQEVNVSGYKARGLRARVVWYTRSFSGDTEDYSEVQILCGEDIATSAPVVGDPDVWIRAEHSIAIPEGANNVTVRLIMTGTSGEVPALANIGIAHPQLHVEQASDELIVNGSFESGTFDAWSAEANSFVANTAIDYATNATTPRSAQGGAFASSEIAQSVSIPAGYEHGDAVLTFARSNEFADDGEVILEALDSGDVVLASATTGAVSVASGWSRDKLVVALPEGAASLNVRLVASRALGAGNSGALFDDVSLRIHKHLDPVFNRELDFGTPQRSKLPSTWQQAYLDWPVLAVPMVWAAPAVLPSARNVDVNAEATAEWSDGSFHSAAKFVGHWEVDGAPAMSTGAYRFARALAGSAVDLQVDGYGEFAKADSFSVAVCFRITEGSFNTHCGLVGRRNGATRGWGIAINSDGTAVAVVSGTSGASLANGTLDHRDGAAHWVMMTWDGATLRIIDAAGTSSSAADPGEFAVTGVPMRIGRDGAFFATGGIDIGRVLLWDGVAITQAEFLEHIHRIGVDPNDEIDRSTGWTSSQPVWVDGAADSNGATLVRCATRHIPMGYSATLDASGDAYGLSIGAANTNLVVSTNYQAGISCGPEANVTVQHGIVDPTGLERGVRATNSVANFGYRLTDLPVGAVAGTLRLVCWARVTSGAANVTVRLLDSDDNTSDSEIVALTTLWQRFELALTWTGATPTAHVRFAVEGASGISIELASVVWAGLGDAPTAYQDAAIAIGDRHGVLTETLPLQLHREGEIEVDGVGGGQIGSTLASVDNNTVDLKNRRMVGANSSGNPFLAFHDNTPTGTNQNSDPITWAAGWNLRGRWNQLELPENTGNQIGLVVDYDLAGVGDDYQPFAFAVSTTTPSEKIRLGGGDPNGSTSGHALLRRVAVRAREEKLS